ncbi:iron-sulfur cluster biosynthesis family protein [Alicyclobacillus tolerans]|nr:iron-sulfur cluster biosynthesis family protein [Alicyclobacillus tolerans]MCF8568264.1 iron-sulfur cluster biosynthesis family protein [Alicyclobacillus tolerans]
MALDESITVNDVTLEIEGIPFVYDKRLSYYTEELVIDYAKTWFGKRLVIHSPYSGDC